MSNVLKPLKKSQLFWNSIYPVSKFVPLSFFNKVPENIIIEASAACNLRCPVCPTHFAMQRIKGFMDLDLYKSIVDDMKDLKKKPLLSFNFAGEPLLNKDIGKFVAYATKNNHKTFISTNVTMMTRPLAKELIKSGLASIHLCIDGFTKKSHEGYRVGSKFEEVKNNIEMFLEERKKLKSSTPHVTIQTLLTSFSESEMDEITNWAKEIGADEVQFKSLSMGSYTTPQMKKQYNYLVPKNPQFQRKTSNTYHTLCGSPMAQTVIYWNGDLGLCCIDFDAHLKLTNIKEKGFLKTITSSDIAKKRKLGFQKQYKMCKTCSIGNMDSFGKRIKLR